MQETKSIAIANWDKFNPIQANVVESVDHPWIHGLVILWPDWKKLWPFLKLDQTTPQTVVNGAPNFSWWLNVPWLQLDTLFTDWHVEWRLQWNIEDWTPEIWMPWWNVNLQIWQEMLIRVYNEEEVDIINGRVVYASSATGNIKKVKLASNNIEEQCCRVVGVATENIESWKFWYITTTWLVRDIDTSWFIWWELVYLWEDWLLTNIEPSAPANKVVIWIVVRPHATEWILYVRIRNAEIHRDRDITKEPTGFKNPWDVIITDTVNRTVILTGDTEAYYKWILLSDLVSWWESPAHWTDTSKVYFLTYNGTDYAWRDISVYPNFFQDTLISLTFYDVDNSNRVYMHESHWLMQRQNHKEFHETVGTYRTSGWDISWYTKSSTTDTDRRPDVSQTVIYDEDLPDTLNALTSKSYTIWSNSWGWTFKFDLTQTDIVKLSWANPYYNSFVSPNWTDVLMPANSVATVWLVAIPAAMWNSEQYRYVWIQPQRITQAKNPSAWALAIARADEELRSSTELNFTNLNWLTPESVIIERFTIQYTAWDWTIENNIRLTGTRSNQVWSPSWNYLSVVNTDDSLQWNWTPASPLSISRNWSILVTQRTAEPTTYAVETDYEVLEYTYWTINLYRTVYNTYTPATDVFYTDDTLTTAVASRALSLT